MKFSSLRIIAASALLLCGCSRPVEPPPTDHLAALRSQARQAILECATNEIPGIHAIVETYCDTDSKSPPTWRGRVTLDYVNHNGGIDRTNLRVKFMVGTGISALPDYDYYQEEYLAHLHRIENGQ
jgi:hypothetical protein